MDLGLVMMALGSFRFGVSNGAYQEFSRTAAYRWEKVNRIGRAPALQYAGPDAQEVTIEGVIYPHFAGGLHQMDLIRLQAGLGFPMLMVDGFGWVWKRWVITSVEEKKSFFMTDGAPLKIAFTITLQAYGGDFL
ncbi:MAG: phage tail protein [Halocynthiibacter sp.]